MFEKNQNIIGPKTLWDSRLGVHFLTGDDSRCSSCGAFTKDSCDGHFGHIVLPMPVYHPFHVAFTQQILSKICIICYKLTLKKKGDRERAGFRKFKFEDAGRCEQPQDVEVDMVKYFREDLHHKLLSPDFKKQIDGLELPQKAILSQVKEIVEVLDIIFCWSSLRFSESNTCLLKVIDFLFDLVDALRNDEYSLTDYEASILIPCLVEKSGHNIEKVREKICE